MRSLIAFLALSFLLIGSQVGCVLKSNSKTLAAPAELMVPSNMIALSGGTFTMGFNHGEPHEHPEHVVSLEPFYIDRTEVTNAAYQSCVEANVCLASPYREHGVFGRLEHPVVGIPWREALRFCKWTGKRLPTEAEWEFAARSPKFSYYPWADSFVPTRANGRGIDDGYENTAPVGRFKTGNTATGISDLAGNVAEWTADWFDSTYYSRSPQDNPRGPEFSTGSKVVRGGSWADTEYALRSTARSAMDPQRSNDALGFRCAAPKK